MHIHVIHSDLLAPIPCGACRSLMRFIGTEPHPVTAATDIHTYSCLACENVEAVTVPIVPRDYGASSISL